MSTVNSTINRRRASKERFWRSVVRRWRRSGLSVRAYCEEHELSQASFYLWRRTLAERRAAARDAPVHFVPVQVAPELVPQATADDSAGALELILGAGRRLRIGRGFDAPTLQRLLALLEEGRP